MNSRKVMKRKLIIISAIAVILVYNIVWCINYFRYKPFVDVVGKDAAGNSSFIDSDKICYSAFYPHYLRFTGNLAMTHLRDSSLKNGDVLVDMIIWPIPFKNQYKIGVTINKIDNVKTNNKYGSPSFTQDTIYLLLNDKMEFINTPSEAELDAMNKYKFEVEQYYEKAKQMWGIFE